MEENDQKLNPIPPVSPVILTPPSDPVSITEKPKPKFPLALTIGALILLLVIGSAAGFYVYKQQSLKATKPTHTVIPGLTRDPSPTPNTTIGWKTYINSSLGFSFSYPKELNYLYDQFGFNHPSNPEGNLLLQNFDGSKTRQYQPTDFQMVVEAYKNSDQSTLDKYVKDPNKVWNQSGVQTFTKITLGNEPALKGLAIQKNEKVPTIWVSHKGYILTIYLETPKSTKASLFDQILSTFKFTH